MYRFMLDTNIFDKLLNDEELIGRLRNCDDLCITNIQKAELYMIPDSDKKSKILKLFDYLNIRTIPHPFSFQYIDFEYFSFVSRKEVEDLKIGNERHLEDALIETSALMENLTLVTEDDSFRKRVMNRGFSVIGYDEFKNTVITDE